MSEPYKLEDFLQEEDEKLASIKLEAKTLAQAKRDLAREQALEAFMTRDLKPNEAANILGVHVSTLKKMLKNGSLSGYRIGSRGDWRVTREALQAFKTRGGNW